MEFKEYLKKMFVNFFIITALVNFAIFILGSVYRKGTMISYDAFLAPPLYGFAGTLPGFILYSKKELTVKKMIVRKILHFIVLEALLMLVAFPGNGFGINKIPEMTGFAISVLVIYLIVNFILWIIDKKKATDLMKDLKNYQSMTEG